MIFGIIKNLFIFFLVFQPTTFILWWFYSATKNFINFFYLKKKLSIELIESPKFITIFLLEMFHNAKEPANNKKELSSHNVENRSIEYRRPSSARNYKVHMVDKWRGPLEDCNRSGALTLWSASNTNLLFSQIVATMCCFQIKEWCWTAV